MSSHTSEAKVDLAAVQAPGFESTRKIALIAGAAGLVGAIVLALLQDGGMRHLQFSWLWACFYFVTLGLGALFFVLLQHLTRAGWSVVVRRLAEHVMSTLPFIGLLLLPLVLLTLMGNGDLFLWAKDEVTPLVEGKLGFLNGPFFLIRFAVYLTVWAGLARFFKKRSLAQDSDGDAMHTVIMQRRSAPGMFLFALSLTFASFDFIMSLDPEWFSTMFGVYVFGGAFVSFMSLLGLISLRAEKTALKGLVNVEHFHDIGKLMFAFIFFWGYIAFSQFVLIWYADIPEETLWFKHRMFGPFANISWVLVFGHIFIPFLGLLSRHVKRNRMGLKFWAIWILVMHAVDLFWLIMPSYLFVPGAEHPAMYFPLMEICCWISVAGVFAYVALGSAANKPLVPVKDPRLAESLAFENI
jgi:hypothetical protein